MHVCNKNRGISCTNIPCISPRPQRIPNKQYKPYIHLNPGKFNPVAYYLYLFIITMYILPVTFMFPKAGPNTNLHLFKLLILTIPMYVGLLYCNKFKVHLLIIAFNRQTQTTPSHRVWVKENSSFSCLTKYCARV